MDYINFPLQNNQPHHEIRDLGDASMKLKCFNLHTNWLILRLECVKSKNEIKSGGHQVIFRDIELLLKKIL